jgi:hypothetical protein
MKELYARALDEPVPEDWHDLAERIEAALASGREPDRS